MEINIQYLRETQAILLNNKDTKFKRFLYEKINFQDRLIGIVGPRGVGKTTLLLQYLKLNHDKDEAALYVLADNIFFRQGDLFEFAREFHLKHGGKLLCIDEIHRYENWNQELKNIYDSLPDLKIIFSGSSSLNLIRGKYDLSRRALLYSLPGLSFREYLAFEKDIEIKALKLNDLFAHSYEISKKIAQNKYILKYFNDYLKQGYYPFYKENPELHSYNSRILNTIDKAVYEDIGSFYNLKTQNLIIFKKILHFLCTIPPGEININKLANSLKHNNATISEYLEILKETSLIRFLPNNKTGHAMIRNAVKVFLDNSNIFHALNIAIGHVLKTGTVRELFLLNQLQNAGYIATFTKNGDFEIDQKVIEIGGRSKNFTQIRSTRNGYLALDDILIGERRKIPLYLFGFLY